MSKPFIALQRALPQHALSRFGGSIAASERRWLAQLLIRGFMRAYNVDLAEAERTRREDYRSFNDFFTRGLKAGARPMPSEPNSIACPADGTVSEAGPIEAGRVLQAKGIHYSADALIGGGSLTGVFDGGSFATIYLAPSNYHRVHTPLAGRLVRSRALPGELYSVNATTAGNVEALFARNERLVCEFEADFGPFVVVLVGAMIVASIEAVFDAPTSPYREQVESAHDVRFERGDELGRFLLGSTAIVLLPEGAGGFDATAGESVRMGETIGTIAD
ncbi:MAG: archaetidylserine decarboxylase [Pseudomonadaceae bacterium]|nr:archaetidylserine decarboxylase [Pseudomonadaceae bacterium]